MATQRLRKALDGLLAIQTRLAAAAPRRLRPYLASLETGDRAILFVGARGVGKTTFLVKRLAAGHFFYVSADNPLATTVPLYDLIEAAFMEGFEGVFLDEVHYAAEWSRHLKAAYDAFPGKTLWASDSSTVVLREGVADLSRRFRVSHIPLLSFREYLALREGLELPAIDPYRVIPSEAAELLQKTNILRLFKEYLAHGFRPIFLEGTESYPEKVMNTIAKAMQADIPFLVPQISENHLRLMNAVVGYLAVSPVPTLAVNTLCNEWSLSKEKLYQLLDAMERAHLLRIVRRQNDTRRHSIGAKIFLYEPSVYTHLSRDPGTLRESFVAGSAIEAGRQVFASANEEQYDFLIDDRRIEVGGSRKSRKGADFVVSDDIDLPVANRIPLWLLGMEY